MVGIPFLVVSSYKLYERCMSLMALNHSCFGLMVLVILKREQRPPSESSEGPLDSRRL